MGIKQDCERLNKIAEGKLNALQSARLGQNFSEQDKQIMLFVQNLDNINKMPPSTAKQADLQSLLEKIKPLEGATQSLQEQKYLKT